MSTTPPVLVAIDVQNGFHDPSWGATHNPACEDNIRELLGHWRSRGWPVVLVRHDSTSPTSPLRPGQPGNNLQPGIDGPHSLFVTKTVNSAFYGTPDLDAWLTESGYSEIVIGGITTNFCCETTARMAGNLGYRVTFVIDATRTFDHRTLDGATIPADTMATVTAANLNGEFGEVVTVAQVLQRHRLVDDE